MRLTYELLELFFLFFWTLSNVLCYMKSKHLSEMFIKMVV